MAQSDRVAVILAVIAAIGGWGTTAITNWDKLTGGTRATSEEYCAESKTFADAKKAAVRSIARALEYGSDVSAKAAQIDHFPGLTAEEVRYRGLKRAVFLQPLTYEANSDLLLEALSTMMRQGADISEAQVCRVTAELPEILSMKLQWLKKEAVPQLRAYMEDPANQMKQEQPHVDVLLPEKIWIIPGSNATTTVSELHSLEEEVSLLEAAL